jgi:hypothetical protein
MMLAPMVLMLLQALDYPVKRMLADMNIGVGRDLLVYRLVCHFFKPVLMPKWTMACFPDQAAHIAKLATATTNH